MQQRKMQLLIISNISDIAWQQNHRVQQSISQRRAYRVGLAHADWPAQRVGGQPLLHHILQLRRQCFGLPEAALAAPVD